MLEFIRERWGLILVGIAFAMIIAFIVASGHRPPRRSWSSIFTTCIIVIGGLHHAATTWDGNWRYPWR